MTPGALRRDEAVTQAVVTAFYQAIGAKNLEAMQRVALPSATAVLSGDRTAPVLVPMRTMVDVPERRNQNGGVRVVRTEFRPDGDVATDRIGVVSRSRDGRREFEAADIVILARRGGEWRIAHVVFGPWKVRTAP
jgi:hypothetical protein